MTDSDNAASSEAGPEERQGDDADSAARSDDTQALSGETDRRPLVTPPMPASGHSESRPVPDQTASEPVPDKPTSEPAPDQTASAPVPDKPTSEPVPDQTASEPVPDQTASEPVAEQSGPSDNGSLDLLCAAVTSMARVARGRSLFVGWTAAGLPAATTRLSDLTANAREMLAAFHGSGLPSRQIPYTAVVPVTYALTGPAVDFADHGRNRAEDQIRYQVVDALGERRDLALGERSILGAIVAARTPWQATGGRMAAAPAVSAVPMYSVFVPLPGASVDTGLAMLFEPTVFGSTNEPAMRSFVRHTIGRLLVLDESQPPKSRKGYLEAAGKLAGTMPRSGSMQTLVALRRMGMVDFDDNWLKSLEMAKRRTKGRFIQALRGLGMVEISDEMLDELTHPRPDYDVDQLDVERMFDLAEAMYAVANRLLSPPTKSRRPQSKRR